GRAEPATCPHPRHTRGGRRSAAMGEIDRVCGAIARAGRAALVALPLLAMTAGALAAAPATPDPRLDCGPGQWDSYGRPYAPEVPVGPLDPPPPTPTPVWPASWRPNGCGAAYYGP